MNTSLLKLLSVVAVPSMLAVGCGGSSGGKADLAVKGGDMAKGGDLAVSGACTQIGAWPTTQVEAFNSTDTKYFQIGLNGFQANATTAANVDVLQYEYFGDATKPLPSLPHTYTSTSTDTYGQCVDCTAIYFNVDQTQQGSGDIYFATSGSVTVTKLDNGTTGMVAASGTNMHLVHWDYDGMGTDAADADGKCIDVASYNFSGSYDNTPTDM